MQKLSEINSVLLQINVVQLTTAKRTFCKKGKRKSDLFALLEIENVELMLFSSAQADSNISCPRQPSLPGRTYRGKNYVTQKHNV